MLSLLAVTSLGLLNGYRPGVVRQAEEGCLTCDLAAMDEKAARIYRSLKDFEGSFDLETLRSIKLYLGILCVIHASRSKPQRFGSFEIPGVVFRGVVHIHPNWFVQDVVEAQILDVALNPVNVEVDHRLPKTQVRAFE